MKRKVVLLLSVILVALLAITLLTSCKASAKDLAAFTDEDSYLWAQYDVAPNPTWKQNTAIDENYKTVSGAPYLYSTKDGLTSVYCLTTESTVVSGIEDAYLNSTGSYSHMLQITRYFDESRTVSLYDSYGKCFKDFSLGDDYDFEFEYETYIYKNGKEYNVYKLTIETDKDDAITYYVFESLGSTNKYTTDVNYSEGVYVPTAVGSQLPTDRDTFNEAHGIYCVDTEESYFYIIAGEKYMNYQIETCETDGGMAVAIYDEDGKLKATTVVPNDYYFVTPISEMKVLMSRTIKVSQGTDDYSYVNEDGTPVVLEYYSIDFLKGKIEKVKLNYVIDEVYNWYNALEYNMDANNIENSYIKGIGNVGLIGREFKDGIIASETSYIVLNDKGTVKVDATETLYDKGIFGSITKIADSKYLVRNDDKAFIANGKFEKIVDLNCKVYKLDIKNQIIIGEYTKNGDTYYGSLNFDGNVVVPFRYTSISDCCAYDDLHYTAVDMDDDETYIVNFATGTRTKIGLDEDNDTYTAVFENIGYYTTTLKATTTQYYSTTYTYETSLYSFDGKFVCSGTYTSYNDNLSYQGVLSLVASVSTNDKVTKLVKVASKGTDATNYSFYQLTYNK